jgi:hypothetical protein
MAQIDTHRASYNRPNPNLPCGKRTGETTPTITQQTDVFYTLDAGGKRIHCKSISEVNAKLSLYPNAKVVKSTRTTTIQTSHKRIK